MTRQPSASFAQFFPAAPRAARDRATEREKAKAKTQDTPATSGLLVGQKSGATASLNGTSARAPSGTDGLLSDSSQQPADGHESPLGDTLNAVGSASSYASTGSSSVFSTSARQAAPNGSSHIPTTSGTPLTSIESPSYSGNAGLPKTNMVHAQTIDRDEASASRNTPLSRLNGSLPEPSPIERTPARDLSRTTKGIKCTYDPFNDRTLSKHNKKSAKPIYKEFGLEDDTPPPDPRLAKGGRLGYINTDFHLPKSRLRQSPYNLKPYPYDSKTSLGPGPPTQIVVTGFNPLITFSKVTAAFATFGDIAESSNKMHPETGSYLGFATFRYKDAHPGRSRLNPIRAIDAARRAVKAMHGQRIEANQIRVEYDPEGKKSASMLEEALRRERASQDVHTVHTASKAPPTGPRVNVPEKVLGPPPLAPKGPSSHRQAVAGVPPWVPSQPKGHVAIEDKAIAKQLENDPYVFVAHEHVPVMVTTIPHMKKRLKAFAFDEIRIDRTGYFIVFPNTFHGRNEAMKCYRAANHTDLFTYNMVMQLYLPQNSSRDSESAAPAPRSRRTPSPERKRRTDQRLREDKDRRRREEEADLEEEKRQRAKNFDPVMEACDVVARELAEHLIKHIRSRVAAPTLTNFLNPSNHVAMRQKLGLRDPAGSVPSVTVDAGDESPGGATPNSGADPIERRTGRLEISSLPRIRKAKATGHGARNNVGFMDPFSRKRAPQSRGAFRSLHHRLKSYDSDVESDEEVEVRESVARDTEEPDSRPRSRMSTDDDVSREDFASWGPAEEDSMTEASFAVVDGLTSTKKRKLDLELRSAVKRHKKSDEELFGVTLDNMEPDLPVHEISEEATPDVDMADVRSETRSETPALSTKASAKKLKSKKKSKKQLFEEREALKKQQQAQSVAETEEEEPVPAKTPVEEVKPEPEPAPALAAKREDEPVAAVDFTLYSTTPRRALDLPTDFKLDIATMQELSLSAADMPDLARLSKRFGGADLGDPLLWLWRRNRVRELNSKDGSIDRAVGIEGYYVSNSTGSARTEGVKKILNAEKSKYLPHHIKVQKQREARQAKYKKDGKDAAVEASRLAVAEKVVAKGNSRANRANNRRHVSALQDEKKMSGDSDAFKFNQLKKRKKPVKFARSAIHNWGLYTEENINKDDMIIEYVGEQVRQSISEIREKRYLKSGMGSSYLFRIDDNTVIDATKKGGIARFINHSCMPNCTAKIIKVDGSKRIVIYALRDIAQHEELTYDYKFEREIGSLDRIPCLCGTAACKGFLN
ncbi:Histone-lysine N-methyltransferase, H3 lysine-4 specific [Colletotrichum fructicola]|uniref:Histone-lysine N-methyltransferase, H3 lysine-4 specific n=1 Tax=Colletotrichum fructicola (strain Nara gc5) TaxID=1213859 RepID=L2GFX7_COLFN|nr:Histone-lysine N-methyltransferase, H3 lysine-4 specific [Colletotrichum fructicola]KAE9577586.1 Histone-lysine N-methyltransferase, H3 lysine-4 specific [Colletotrichum fructicola]KAF4411662.1 Histone-lysine N-methyltransferase, H3 lysine-4 specific [Colletotrichum fructicola]KAF4488589.1 Histone-lysine N-methyltransferase, H3 lysine-4 specific [Colletotrichum fructicola Nara gc5]KAF4906041.1 Histone-lysine N-methyltransferase, H3 lysine-4 specific [Colletotrichum fructicola]